jgi:outer membrane immunogenic protein
MKQRTNLFLIAAAFCVATICFAPIAKAGTEPKEIAPAPMVEEPFSWTGFYIGGNLGGNWSSYEFGNFFTDVDVDQVADQFFLFNNMSSGFTDGKASFGFASFLFPGTGSEGTLFDAGSDDGVIGGGQLGFQKQFGHFVVGLEGDFQRTATDRWATFTGTATNFFDNEGFAITDVTINRRAETDWQASARAKFGWANDHVLFYVTGGAAFAHVNVFANDSARTEFFQFIFLDGGILGGGTAGDVPIGSTSLGAISNSNFSKDDETLLGWTAGIGSEYAINHMFTIGMEYRHSDFGSHTFNFNANGGPIFPGPMKVDLENDMVLVKFNILLNHFFGH